MCGRPSEQLSDLGRRFADAAERFTADVRLRPAESSRRMLDDRRVAAFISPGHVAAGQLLAAYDALSAVAALWQHDRVRVVADSALLRAAVECTSTAWWVLAPGDSDERLRRAMRVVVGDLVRARVRESSAVAMAITDAARTERAALVRQISGRLSRVERAFRASGVPSEAPLYRRRQLNTLELVHGAQQSLPKTSDVELTSLWGMLSSLSHGSESSIAQLVAAPPSGGREGADGRERADGGARADDGEGVDGGEGADGEGAVDLPMLTPNPIAILGLASATAQLVDATDALWRSYSAG